MKKSYILILLFMTPVSFSQVLPVNYKIVSNNFSGQRNVISNLPNKVLLSQLSSPINSSSIISNFISDIIVTGDTIWFGTGKGISRTINNGISFQNYYGTTPFHEDDISGMTIYNNYVIVATATTTYRGDEPIPTGTGIKVSSDYGITWNAYPQPTDPNPYSQRYDTIQYGQNPIPALIVTATQQNLSYDVLVTRNNPPDTGIVIWITSWAGALRKSTDYGATFQRVILPPDTRNFIHPDSNYTGNNNFSYDPVVNDNHKCFSIAAENDSTIYVGTAGGINKSTDWGVSWRKYSYSNTNAGISGNFVVALGVQRFGSSTVIWGATNIGGDSGQQFAGVSYTSNGGQNWSNSLNDQEPIFSHNLGFNDSIVYVATDNGIWRSIFNPSTGNFQWSKPSIIYDETTRDRIITNLFYSANVKGDSVWVGSGDGLARTTETSSPWTGKWKIFRAYQPIVSTEETYAAPNPFSPDDEALRIFYKTGKNPASITIRIFDFAMEPVRVLIQNAQRTNPDVIWTIWDGKRDDGMQVANGVYFYRIEVDKEVTAWGKILVLQ